MNLRMKSPGENLDFRELLDAGGESLEARTGLLAQLLEDASRKDRLPIFREVCSETGPRVRVREASGSVREVVMLGSNNYLGLASHPLVKQRAIAATTAYGVGMGGPALLNGMGTLHRELERALAQLEEQEDTLLFGSGFQANVGWVSALVRAEDTLLFDELSHASTYDGLRLAGATRGNSAQSFLHNDLDDLEHHLRQAQGRRPPGGMVFVAVEGVYSVDGDLAPLRGIVGLCQRYQATLVVDDAHGTGVLGATGAGTAEHFGVASQVDVSMGTLSTTFAVTGGFLAATAAVVNYLRFFARSYLFSSHLPPPSVAAVLGGLEVLRTEPALREALHANVRYLCAGLQRLGLQASTPSAIITLRVPVHLSVRALTMRLHQLGVFVNSLEPPAMPLDGQRVRLTPMATHTREDLDRTLEAFAVVGRELGWF